MKDLYFFTYAYPYTIDYSWKRNELSFLQDHFKVTIIPYIYQSATAQKNVPEKVSVHSPIIKEKQINTRNKFRFILNTRFLYYISEFFRKKVYEKKSWTTAWLDAVVSTERLMKSPDMKPILENKLDKRNTLFYFYWGVGSSLIIPFLRKLGYVDIIVRFHGFDLYEERKGDYIPFRTDLLKNVHHAIFVSEHGKTYLHNKYNKVDFKSMVLRLGSKKNGKSKPSIDNKLRIVSCSHVIPLKRVHLIAEALRYVDFELEWIHFGDGELFEELKSQVASLPSNIRVELPGRMNPEKVMDYYSNNNIDLFLNVSNTEGVPVSIMEAFSAGIPVYATKVGGTPEIVNSENGKLFDVNISPVEFAREIESFYHLESEKKHKLRQAALNTYANMCDLEALNAQFINFLKSI